MINKQENCNLIIILQSLIIDLMLPMLKYSEKRGKKTFAVGPDKNVMTLLKVIYTANTPVSYAPRAAYWIIIGMYEIIP